MKLRKLFIVLLGLAIVACGFGYAFAGGGKGGKETTTEAPVTFATEDEMWAQFSGLELNFLTEDTPAAGAIVTLLPEFEKKTGMRVNVTRTNISDLVTKLMLELGSGSSNMHIIYSARWQIPPGRSDALADLRKFESDPSLPKGTSRVV